MMALTKTKEINVTIISNNQSSPTITNDVPLSKLFTTYRNWNLLRKSTKGQFPSFTRFHCLELIFQCNVSIYSISSNNTYSLKRHPTPNKRLPPPPPPSLAIISNERPSRISTPSSLTCLNSRDALKSCFHFHFIHKFLSFRYSDISTDE